MGRIVFGWLSVDGARDKSSSLSSFTAFSDPGARTATDAPISRRATAVAACLERFDKPIYCDKGYKSFGKPQNVARFRLNSGRFTNSFHYALPPF